MNQHAQHGWGLVLCLVKPLYLVASCSCCRWFALLPANVTWRAWWWVFSGWNRELLPCGMGMAESYATKGTTDLLIFGHMLVFHFGCSWFWAIPCMPESENWKYMPGCQTCLSKINCVRSRFSCWTWRFTICKFKNVKSLPLWTGMDRY